MNIGGINAQKIYQENTENKINSFRFLNSFGEQIMQIQARVLDTFSDIRIQVKTVLKKKTIPMYKKPYKM